jgi:mutual gliding-motility protein MglA
MAHLDFLKSRIKFKIVYYGPGLCGKTTNLERLRAATRGACEMTALDAEGDRTIFFDYMPLDLGKIDGIETVFKLYTVPGQVKYNSTRQTVLSDVDGVVFVADSRASALESDIESLSNLAENLAEAGVDLGSLPLVLQYNKRDLPDAMPIEALERALNPRRVKSFSAAALSGDGVEETFSAIAGEVYRCGVQRYGLSPSPEFAALVGSAERLRYRSSIPPLGVDAADDWRSIASSRPPFALASEPPVAAVTSPPPTALAVDSLPPARNDFERKMLAHLEEIRRILEQLAMTSVDRDELGEIEVGAAEVQRQLAEQIARNTERLEALAAGTAELERTLRDLREAIARDIRREVDNYLSDFVHRGGAGPALDADAPRSQLSLELLEEEEVEAPPPRGNAPRLPVKETQPPPRRRALDGRYRGPGQDT